MIRPNASSDSQRRPMPTLSTRRSSSWSDRLSTCAFQLEEKCEDRAASWAANRELMGQLNATTAVTPYMRLS